jgi:hypothetical protein
VIRSGYRGSAEPGDLPSGANLDQTGTIRAVDKVEMQRAHVELNYSRVGELIGFSLVKNFGFPFQP